MVDLSHYKLYFFTLIHAQGIGIQVKHAENILNEDECKLWDSGVLGYTNPNSQWAFYAVDNVFCFAIFAFLWRK